jgi:hypothetical protein
MYSSPPLYVLIDRSIRKLVMNITNTTNITVDADEMLTTVYTNCKYIDTVGTGTQSDESL